MKKIATLKQYRFVIYFIDQLVWTNLLIMSIILFLNCLFNDYISLEYFTVLGVSIYCSLLMTVFRLIIVPWLKDINEYK